MLHLCYSGVTDKGSLRPGNEDALAIGIPGRKDPLPLASLRPVKCLAEGVLFLVSDGVGGLSAGEVASRMTVESVLAELASRLHHKPMRATRRRREDLLRTVLGKVNEAVFNTARADPDKARMAATLTALWVAPDGVTTAQAGDSRCYRARGSVFAQLTEDQSKVAAMVRRGEISASEARNHPMRNVIEQAIGVKPELFHPVLRSFDLIPGDRFLLCSDGLTDGLDNDSLAGYFAAAAPADLDQLARTMIDAGIRASGRDNLTVLLVACGRAADVTTGCRSLTGRLKALLGRLTRW